MSKDIFGIIENDSINELKKAINDGIDINTQNDDGDTPLICVINKYYNKEIEQILRQNENNFQTKLMRITRETSTNIIDQLLKKSSNINTQNKNGDTPLIFAASCDQIELTEKLLENGAGVNIQNKNGDTALMFAINNGHTELTDKLLENGANVNIQNNDGYTPLFFAIANNHTKLAMKLLENGADININNKYASRLLSIAINNNCTDVAKKILEKAPDANKDMSLIFATKNGNVELIKLLLDKGADVDMQDSHGSTALMHAIYARSIEMTSLLLEKNADIDLQDYQGISALDFARHYNDHRIVKLIENHKDKKENTTINETIRKSALSDNEKKLLIGRIKDTFKEIKSNRINKLDPRFNRNSSSER